MLSTDPGGRICLMRPLGVILHPNAVILGSPFLLPSAKTTVAISLERALRSSDADLALAASAIVTAALIDAGEKTEVRVTCFGSYYFTSEEPESAYMWLDLCVEVNNEYVEHK
ncbi:unnamed protein product [Microthlaspi erraticum]|uniref:Uncharacterized protein n=1 Tax=Microthlaspi erraticum TaxID=1685480 RepID=A0A6D2KWA5_9BRAS|nr:unnamed protein product [Microthlaspi erraticum]